jgi:hypothetical protein
LIAGESERRGTQPVFLDALPLDETVVERTAELIALAMRARQSTGLGCKTPDTNKRLYRQDLSFPIKHQY